MNVNWRRFTSRETRPGQGIKCALLEGRRGESQDGAGNGREGRRAGEEANTTVRVKTFSLYLQTNAHPLGGAVAVEDSSCSFTAELMDSSRKQPQQ